MYCWVWHFNFVIHTYITICRARCFDSTEYLSNQRRIRPHRYIKIVMSDSLLFCFLYYLAMLATTLLNACKHMLACLVVAKVGRPQTTQCTGPLWVCVLSCSLAWCLTEVCRIGNHCCLMCLHGSGKSFTFSFLSVVDKYFISSLCACL